LVCWVNSQVVRMVPLGYKADINFLLLLILSQGLGYVQYHHPKGTNAWVIATSIDWGLWLSHYKLLFILSKKYIFYVYTFIGFGHAKKSKERDVSEEELQESGNICTDNSD
jgi:hypothetical protein